MPILTVKVSRPADAGLSRKIADTLLDLTVSVLRKRRDLTAITIDFVSPAHWWIGGQNLDTLGLNSFYFDIRIVDGSNTKDEKARYIQACFAAMGELLGNLHPESYIHVHDVRADAYGYGGLTQEHRYVAASLQESHDTAGITTN
jgi:4-oxalocrotonate tautomerase